MSTKTLTRTAVIGSDVHSDIRYALRLWSRRPGFAFTAVMILGLGIGATTAVFSVVDAMLLRPLPWPDADRLVAIHTVWPERRNDPAFRIRTANPKTPSAWNRAPISWQLWQDLKGSSVFEDVGIWHYSVRPYFGLDEARTEVIDTMRTSSSFLSMLGVRLLHGRLFIPDDDYNVNTDAMILSYEGWQRHFEGRSDVIGQNAVLFPITPGRGQTFTIVGVLQPGFQFSGLLPEALLPFGNVSPSYVYERNRSLLAIGKLASGVTIKAASALAESVTPSPTPFGGIEFPPEPRTTRLVSLIDEAADSSIPSGIAVRPLWLMFAGAAVLLVLACSNVAGLLLGEIRARRHEIAVRTALGGTRLRVMRQLAIEHLMLAFAASIVGLLLAAWLTPVLVAMAPDRLSTLSNIRISFRIGAFAMGLGLLTTVLFGLAPSAPLLSARVAEALSVGGREATPRSRKSQRMIVECQFGLTLVLLVSASLFGETILRLKSQPLGFDPGGVAIANIRSGQPVLETPSPTAEEKSLSPLTNQQRSERRRNAGWIQTASVIERLSILPGVESVAGIFNVPFGGSWSNATIQFYGRPLASEHSVQRQFVTERYFETMNITILRGRDFEAFDREAGTAAIVSREFERRILDGDAIGKKFMEGSLEYSVIGVVADVKQRELSEGDSTTFYLLNRVLEAVNHLVVRTSGHTAADTARILPSIRKTLQEHDKRTVVTSTTTMDELLAISMAEQRFRAALSGVFALVALLLAAGGLYGLASRRAADRRREIGIRMSLGASPKDVRALVLRETWLVTGLGILWGLPAASALSVLTQSFLFGVKPTAPHIFLIASGVLTAVAVFATLIPAYRASRIDPVVALRN